MIRLYSVILITFCSCSSHLNYLGSSYTPTQKVDVFVDASAIKRSFTVIGKSSVEIFRSTAANFERMQERAIEKAKEKGANAILFQDLYILENRNSSHVVSRPDSAGKSIVTKPGVISGDLSSRKEILYLKYD